MVNVHQVLSYYAILAAHALVWETCPLHKRPEHGLVEAYAWDVYDNVLKDSEGEPPFTCDWFACTVSESLADGNVPEGAI